MDELRRTPVAPGPRPHAPGQQCREPRVLQAAGTALTPAEGGVASLCEGTSPSSHGVSPSTYHIMKFLLFPRAVGLQQLNEASLGPCQQERGLPGGLREAGVAGAGTDARPALCLLFWPQLLQGEKPEVAPGSLPVAQGWAAASSIPPCALSRCSEPGNVQRL